MVIMSELELKKDFYVGEDLIMKQGDLCKIWNIENEFVDVVVKKQDGLPMIVKNIPQEFIK